MIDELREYCQSFPGFSEDVKWESNLCFCVAERIFVIFSLDAIPTAAAFKVSSQNFEALMERDGFKQAPHFAKGQWISITNINLLSKREWQHYLKASYDLVRSRLTKKQQQELG